MGLHSCIPPLSGFGSVGKDLLRERTYGSSYSSFRSQLSVVVLGFHLYIPQYQVLVMGGYRGGFYENLLEASPVSEGANAKLWTSIIHGTTV